MHNLRHFNVNQISTPLINSELVGSWSLRCVMIGLKCEIWICICKISHGQIQYILMFKPYLTCFQKSSLPLSTSVLFLECSPSPERLLSRLWPGSVSVYRSTETPPGLGSEQCECLPAAAVENTGEQLCNSRRWHDVTFSQLGLWCFHRHPFRVAEAKQNNCHQHGVRSKCLELLCVTSAVFLLEFSFSVQVRTMIFALKQKDRCKEKINKGRKGDWMKT